MSEKVRYAGNLTDLGRDVAELYEELTQISMSCAISGAEEPYSEEEEQLLGEDFAEGLAVQFAGDGKFERIGFAGNWHKVRSFTAADIAKVFSRHKLEEHGVINNASQNRHGEWVAQLAI